MNANQLYVIAFCCSLLLSNQLAISGGSGGNANSSGVNAGAKDVRASTDDDSDYDYDEDETATRELSSWRVAVGNATSSAQLSLYQTQLHRCIAWEKSIMKVVSIASSCFVCYCGKLSSFRFTTHVFCSWSSSLCLDCQTGAGPRNLFFFRYVDGFGCRWRALGILETVLGSGPGV